MLAGTGFVIEMLFWIATCQYTPTYLSDLLLRFFFSISHSVTRCWCGLLESALSHEYENRLPNVLSLCQSKTISASSNN